ncbi:MAG TPA: YafY family protein [Spirochaetia bacterium]|nr:YafY family protein [Spirochaetia bacterium]
MSRTERLFDLLQLLRTYRYPVAAAKLAIELDVTVRTVYRDIATLQALGAPIEGEAGIGYLLRPGFLLPPLMFAREEVEALALGARWVSQRADSRLARAARSALARIEAVLPAKLREHLEDAPLLVGPGTAASTQDARLITLRLAIEQEHKLRLSYESIAGETTERIVWPIALSFFDTVYVVVTWCELREDYRTFRTDRITSVDVLAERYPRNRVTLMNEWRDREGIPQEK